MISASSDNRAAGSVAATGQAGAGAPSPVGDSAESTEDRFLKLLVAQMRNQDPLNPLDNAQVTSQLAQISTVRGLEELNASVSRMASANGTVSPLSAIGLLGRSVLLPGDAFEWGGTASVAPASDPALPEQVAATPAVRLGVELSAAARAVQIDIVDAAGRVVHSRQISGVEAGVATFDWDGTTSDDSAAAAGPYRMRVVALDYGGAQVAAEALVSARVTGVVQAPGGARIEFADRPAQPASAARAIL